MRLTKAMKDDICHKVLKHRFSLNVTSMISTEAVLAEQIYHNLYPEAVLAEINALPKGWLSTTGGLKIQVGGLVGQVSFDGRTRIFGRLHRIAPKREEAVTRRVLCMHSGVAKVYDSGERLGKKYLALVETFKEIDKAIEDARRQLVPALNASTVKSLCARWPEIARFVDVDVKPVPALRTEHLNAMLRLP